MIVKNTEEVESYINHRKVHEMFNLLIHDGILTPMEEDKNGIVENIDDIKRNAEDLLERMEIAKELVRSKLTMDQALIAAIALDFAAQYLDKKHYLLLDNPVLIFHLGRNGHVFREDMFQTNAYFQNIHIKPHTYGAYQTMMIPCKKQEVIMCESPVNLFDAITVPSIGYFDTAISYPAIAKKDHEGVTLLWGTSLVEMLTMQKPMEEANGQVLVLGCGLGYFPYMISEKEEVSKITIVEKQPEIIAIFKEQILPQFAHKEKVEIIQMNPNEYVNTISDGMFDYCFAAAWINSNDTDSYIRLRRACSKFRKMKMTYWLEDALLLNIRSIIFDVILSAFFKTLGIVETLDVYVPEASEYTLKFINRAFTDVCIDKEDDLHYYLNLELIKHMIDGSMHWKGYRKKTTGKLVSLLNYRKPDNGE